MSKSATTAANTTNAMKQEGFFIADETTVQRKKIVRQDRLQIEPGKCFVEISGVTLELVNVSTFGCAAILTPEHVKKLQATGATSETWTAKVTYEGAHTQTLQLRKMREETQQASANGDVVWGFEIVGEPFKIERLKVLELTTTMFKKQNEYAAKINRFPLVYRQLVFQVKDWFQRMKESIDELERSAPVDNSQEANEYRMTVIENVGAYMGDIMPKVYNEIPAMLKGLSKEDTQMAIEFVREQLGLYIYGAPFAARAYYKPRGYAGDYEMMNQLYRSEPTGRTLFDQCMHKYFVDEPAGAAVKNRGYYLRDKLKNLIEEKPPHLPMKILSVASGPAVEQQMLLQECKELYGRPLEFTCLDQDEESLKHAQRQMLSIDRFVKSGFNFKFKNLAIRNVIASGLPENDYDVIYSAGLFDYFTEPVAQMAAQKMMQSLKPGGQLIIGNFSKDNPTVTLMEIWLDWNLIYRSAEDLERMFKGFGSKITVEKEPLGVNLFVVIQK